MRAPVAGARRRPPVWLLATLCYVLLAVLATWPLLRDADTKVAGAATDPVLNTGVLGVGGASASVVAALRGLPVRPTAEA